MKTKDILSYALVAIGMLQILGHVSQLKWIKQIGLLSVASPLPIVFTQVKGIETFAQDFFVAYQNELGDEHSIKITPEIYKKLDAPYNYKNVIGAAISYGAILPDTLTQPVLYYCLINPGQLTALLPTQGAIYHPKIVLNSRTKGRRQTWVLQVGKEI